MKFLPYHAYEVCMSRLCGFHRSINGEVFRMVLIDLCSFIYYYYYFVLFCFYMTYAHIIVFVLGSITTI